MSIEDLRKRRLIKSYKVPAEEIEGILAAAKSDIKTAQGLLNTDICWAFSIAYNAILQGGIALMHVKGFRPAGEAKHVSVVLFLREALGKDFRNEWTGLTR